MTLTVVVISVLVTVVVTVLMKRFGREVTSVSLLESVKVGKTNREELEDELVEVLETLPTPPLFPFVPLGPPVDEGRLDTAPGPEVAFPLPAVKLSVLDPEADMDPIASDEDIPTGNGTLPFSMGSLPPDEPVSRMPTMALVIEFMLRAVDLSRQLGLTPSV